MQRGGILSCSRDCRDPDGLADFIPMPATETDEALAYEKAYDRLEAIVHRLEQEESPLDELVRDYEEGMRMLQICQNRLQEASLRIEKVRADSEVELEPWEEPGEAEDDR